MKKTFLTLATVALSAFISFGQTESDRVIQCFENYKKAILQGQGSEAIKYVDKTTVDYYGTELNLALSGDSATIDQLSLIDKLTVFIARHKMDPAVLKKMNGRDFFIYAVDKGMIGKNSVATTEVVNVSVDGNSASGQMSANGVKTPLAFNFKKEDNQWRVDLTSIFPQTNLALRKALTQQGMSDNDFIFKTLENLTGRAVTGKIWQPIK